MVGGMTHAWLFVLGVVIEGIAIIVFAAPDLVPGLKRFSAWLAPRLRRFGNRARRLLHLKPRAVVHQASAGAIVAGRGTREGHRLRQSRCILEEKVEYLHPARAGGSGRRRPALRTHQRSRVHDRDPGRRTPSRDPSARDRGVASGGRGRPAAPSDRRSATDRRAGVPIRRDPSLEDDREGHARGSPEAAKSLERALHGGVDRRRYQRTESRMHLDQADGLSVRDLESDSVSKTWRTTSFAYRNSMVFCWPRNTTRFDVTESARCPAPSVPFRPRRSGP